MPTEDLVLLNSACVSGEGRLGIVLSVYARRDGKTFFRGSFAKWDSLEGWNKVLEGLEKTEPALPFRFSHLGMENRFSGLTVIDRGSCPTVLRARQRLRSLLGRAVPMESLLKRNEGLNESMGFVLEFEGRGLEEINDFLWHVAERARRPRKKKRIIY
jgi:hypothetical protein